jgi:hypothetical protein
LFSVDVPSLGRSRARLFQEPEIFEEKFDDMPPGFKSAAAETAASNTSRPLIGIAKPFAPQKPDEYVPGFKIRKAS